MERGNQVSADQIIMMTLTNCHFLASYEGAIIRGVFKVEWVSARGAVVPQKANLKKKIETKN